MLDLAQPFAPPSDDDYDDACPPRDGDDVAPATPDRKPTAHRRAGGGGASPVSFAATTLDALLGADFEPRACDTADRAATDCHGRAITKISTR